MLIRPKCEILNTDTTMKLPIPFIKSKNTKNGYYLALLLEDEKISSVILEEDLGKVKIVGKHQQHLSDPLENLSQDELITLVDKAISRAEEVLPPNIETHKTVFGVKESWVETESKKIKKEHLAKLKKVCDALDLTPIGFMVISEAIANLIQAEEGAPLSAILVELGKKFVYATLFRGGQISESFGGQIEHSSPLAVDILLKKFTAPVLPAKIILSHSSDSKNTQQHFMHHEWSKSLPFLHVPQITVLPEDFDAKAVAVGAAHQMGFEILGITHTDLHEKQAEAITHKEPVHEIAPPPPVDVPLAGDNFGFVTNQDIADQPIKKHTQEAPIEEKTLNLQPEDNNDFEKEEISSKESDDQQELTHSPNADDDTINNRSRAKGKSNFNKYFAMLPKVSLPKNIKLPKSLKNKRFIVPLTILGLILLFGAGISAFYFYNVKAEVVLSVRPKEVTRTENITFSTSAGNDFSKNVIAAKSISVDVEGEASTNATGKKDTGEKAKGTVTVFNSSNREASLSSGTTITSNNGINFTLDKDVKLASASGDIFTGTKPGTTQVTVTAKDIGQEANLPSNTRFTIGGNSSLAAKNDNAFSGGSKKTLNVVSRNDLAKLRSELPKELEKKALEQITTKKGDGETILPGFVKTSITDEDFDKDVDDEAKEVKLKAIVKFEGMSYDNEDLENFDKSVLKDNYSEDISFANNSIKNELKNTKVKNANEIQSTASIVAGLLPQINSNEVAVKLRDKSSKEAKDILSTLPQVTNSEIKYSPNIFFLSGIFPRLPNNIKVTVKPE